MTDDDPRVLVSTDWLALQLADPDLRVVDASWHMPGSRLSARDEYGRAHIPGARFFDIEEIADARSELPNMAPPPEKYMSRMRALGIGDGHQIVVYDTLGLFSAARVWWTFQLMGHRDVAVLDGGFPKWLAEGRPVEDVPPMVRDRHMSARFQNQLVRDVTQVSRASKLGMPQIVDARAPERFSGAVPEPRPDIRAGHIPGARNLPYTTLLAANGTLRPPGELRARFEAAGVDLNQPVITTCGSGVTAAVLCLALARIGHDDWSLYDGSWTEWGQFEALPIETGDA